VSRSVPETFIDNLRDSSTDITKLDLSDFPKNYYGTAYRSAEGTAGNIVSFFDNPEDGRPSRSIFIAQDDKTGNNIIVVNEGEETTIKVIEQGNREEFADYVSDLK
jgi:hypothetical protein